MPALPFVDEHAVDVHASPGTAWRALGEVLPGAFGARGTARVARLLGCRDVTRTGRTLEEGATIPGFRVARAEPDRELALEGRHRFSRYALVFRIDPPGSAPTRLRAETRAAFPGAAGRLYGAAVVGTRGHVVVVRRLLRAVRRRAERA